MTTIPNEHQDTSNPSGDPSGMIFCGICREVRLQRYPPTGWLPACRALGSMLLLLLLLIHIWLMN